MQSVEECKENCSLLRNDMDHIEFVQRLIVEGTENERLNYISYLKALREGLLENHQGRFVYISRGKMLNKSLKLPHDVLDHFPQSPESSPYEHAVFVYVPQLQYKK